MASTLDMKTITAPALNDPKYGANIKEQFSNIDDNFKILSNHDFVKGDAGVSYTSELKPLLSISGLTYLTGTPPTCYGLTPMANYLKGCGIATGEVDAATAQILSATQPITPGDPASERYVPYDVAIAKYKAKVESSGKGDVEKANIISELESYDMQVKILRYGRDNSIDNIVRLSKYTQEGLDLICSILKAKSNLSESDTTSRISDIKSSAASVKYDKASVNAIIASKLDFAKGVTDSKGKTIYPFDLLDVSYTFRLLREYDPSENGNPSTAQVSMEDVIILDARFVAITTDLSEASLSVYSDLQDLACTVGISVDPVDSHLIYTVLENFPTLYYDTDQKCFCWKYAGNYTGIIAQGPKGKDGISPNIWIVGSYTPPSPAITATGQNVDIEWYIKPGSGEVVKVTDKTKRIDDERIGEPAFAFINETVSDVKTYITTINASDSDTDVPKKKYVFCSTSNSLQSILSEGDLIKIMKDFNSNSSCGGLFVPYKTVGDTVWVHKMFSTPIGTVDGANALNIGPSKSTVATAADYKFETDLNAAEGSIGKSRLNLGYREIHVGDGANTLSEAWSASADKRSVMVFDDGVPSNQGLIIRKPNSGMYLSARDNAPIKNTIKYGNSGSSSTWIPTIDMFDRTGDYSIGCLTDFTKSTKSGEYFGIHYLSDSDYENGYNTPKLIFRYYPIDKLIYLNGGNVKVTEDYVQSQNVIAGYGGNEINSVSPSGNLCLNWSMNTSPKIGNVTIGSDDRPSDLMVYGNAQIGQASSTRRLDIYSAGGYWKDMKTNTAINVQANSSSGDTSYKPAITIRGSAGGQGRDDVYSFGLLRQSSSYGTLDKLSFYFVRRPDVATTNSVYPIFSYDWAYRSVVQSETFTLHSAQVKINNTLNIDSLGRFICNGAAEFWGKSTFNNQIKMVGNRSSLTEASDKIYFEAVDNVEGSRIIIAPGTWLPTNQDAAKPYFGKSDVLSYSVYSTTDNSDSLISAEVASWNISRDIQRVTVALSDVDIKVFGENRAKLKHTVCCYVNKFSAWCEWEEEGSVQKKYFYQDENRSACKYDVKKDGDHDFWTKFNGKTISFAVDNTTNIKVKMSYSCSVGGSEKATYVNTDCSASASGNASYASGNTPMLGLFRDGIIIGADAGCFVTLELATSIGGSDMALQVTSVNSSGHKSSPQYLARQQM